MTCKWSIKEMAVKTNLPENTLRYYEKEHLIQPERGENGYRYYSEKDFTTLKYIIVMKYANFPLKEIKNFLQNMSRPLSETCNEDSRFLIQSKITEMKAAIRLYQKIITLLENLPSNESFEVISQNYEGYLADNNQFIDQLFQAICLKEGN